MIIVLTIAFFLSGQPYIQQVELEPSPATDCQDAAEHIIAAKHDAELVAFKCVLELSV